MNITAIYGATPNMAYNSDLLSGIVIDTLLELGVYVDEVKLIDKNIPYLNGTSPNINVANIMSTISNSDGVIFICTTNFFSPSSVMQNFLDYFSLPIYKNILKNKNCFILTVSNTTGEKSSLQYLSQIVQELGGFDSIKIGLNFELARLITSNQDYKSTFERYVEDFYRYVNQNRTFFIATDVPTIVNSVINNRIDSSMLQQDENYNISPNKDFGNQSITNNKHISNYNPSSKAGVIRRNNNSLNNYTNNLKSNMRNDIFLNQKPKLQEMPKNNMNNVSSLNNVYNNNIDNNTSNEDELFLQSILNNDDTFDSVKNEISQSVQSISNNNSNNFDRHQSIPQDYSEPQQKRQNDIKEMAKYFQGKYSPSSNNKNNERVPVINEPLVEQPIENIVPRDKTTKQLTKSLIHYYQPTLGNGLVAEIQLNITGKESFDGFLRINNNQCDYFDGWSNSPDVTIVSSDLTWKKVLEGELSSQRAFMTGQLKVRGNFVILSKFDQLFGL